MTVSSNNSCGAATATANYNITINPENSVNAASSSPTLTINTLLTDITHTTSGTINIGEGSTNLPEGVSFSFESNTITISGTPTQAGTFNYSIPLMGCGNINATGTIIVTDPNTLVDIITVGNASSSPTLCNNTALTNITHITTGATGIGTATGLPPGVTASFESNTIIISGTPTQAGTFNYSIPLTGGTGTVDASGTIIVSPTPLQPFTACYQTATFNTTTCSWDVTGTQPTQPSATNCWDNYQFNTTSCQWLNNG